MHYQRCVQLVDAIILPGCRQIMKILITGFEPFDGSMVNPSKQLLLLLDKVSIPGVSLVTSLLPVVNKYASEALLSSLEQHNPDSVICLGQASGRSVISIEKVAINLLNFSMPDNEGTVIKDQKIYDDSPDAYFSTLPVSKLVNHLTNQKIPVEISYSAGTYLCNQVFYTLMHSLNKTGSKIPAGFIHLPALPEQAAVTPKPIPSMSMETMFMALTEIIIYLNNISKK